MQRFRIKYGDLTSGLCKQIKSAHLKEDILLDIEYYPNCVDITSKSIRITSKKFQIDKKDTLEEDEFTTLVWIDYLGYKTWEVELTLDDVDMCVEGAYTSYSEDERRDVVSLILRIRKDPASKWFIPFFE